MRSHVIIFAEHRNNGRGKDSAQRPCLAAHAGSPRDSSGPESHPSSTLHRKECVPLVRQHGWEESRGYRSHLLVSLRATGQIIMSRSVSTAQSPTIPQAPSRLLPTGLLTPLSGNGGHRRQPGGGDECRSLHDESMVYVDSVPRAPSKGVPASPTFEELVEISQGSAKIMMFF